MISSPAAPAIPDLDLPEVRFMLDPTQGSALARWSSTQDEGETLKYPRPEQDMLVPLNDLSQLEPVMTDTPDDVVMDVAARPNSESGEDPTATTVHLITHEDFTVPLNDIQALNDTVKTANGVKRLTISSNDFTRSSETQVAGRFANVREGRRSTPFIYGTKELPLQAAENSFGDEDEDGVEYGRADTKTLAVSSKDIPPLWYKARVSHPEIQHHAESPSQYEYTPVLVFETDDVRTPQPLKSVDSPPALCGAVENDYSTPSSLTLDHDLPDVFDQHYNPPGSYEETSWNDPFGFAGVRQLIRGKLPAYMSEDSNVNRPTVTTLSAVFSA